MSRQAVAESKPTKAQSVTHALSGFGEGKRLGRADGKPKQTGEQGIPGHAFGSLQTSPTQTPAIQPKLKISTPGDKYEREADQIANQVMRMPDGEVGTKTPSATPLVTPVQTQSVQRGASSGQSPTVTPSVQSKIEELQRSGGEPLPEDIRDFMEPRLGQDLSAVRTHRNPEANSLAMHLKARAFTVGKHIVFGRGQFLSSKSANTSLLAHELVHTQQQQSFSQSIIQRTPDDESLSGSIDTKSTDVELEERPNQIPSEDLIEANSKLEKQLNRLNRKMEELLRALFGEQRGDEDILGSDVSEDQLKKARRAVSRYRKITRILESFPQLDIAFAAKWLNVLMFTVRVLRRTLIELSASGEVGTLIAEGLDRQLRRIFNSARKLQSKKVIKRGAKLAKAAEEAAEHAQGEESEKKLPEALAKITSDTQRQTVGLSDIEIDIELQQLLFKRQLEINPIKIQVLDAMIEGLESGKVEDRGGPEPTITDQAKEIVKAALSDTSQASRMIARRLQEEPLNRQSLTVVVDAFRLLNDESETRVDIIRERVLMQLGAEALNNLSNAEESEAKLVLDWLAPSFRKDLQFALRFAKKPVGNLKVNDLLGVKDSERPAAVMAAVQSVSMNSLRTLASNSEGRKLLIEMAFQLWSRGHEKQYESIGDELANAIAPSRGFKGEGIQLPALTGISLGIRTSGRKIIVSMDSLDIEQAVAAGFDRRYVLKLFTSGIVIDPEDVIIIKEQADELGSVVPALKLLEMDARGDKTLLGLGALKLRESAEEAKDVISTNALNLIKAQERTLEKSIEKARKDLFNNVPEAYRLEALTALEIFADAGRLALSAEAHAVGSAVGIAKGAIDLGTGTVETAGLVTETASDLNRAAEQDRIFDELKVKTDDVSKTVKVTIVLAPELVGHAIQDIEKRLSKAGIAEKALIISEVEGRISFEIATTIAGSKAPSLLGRLQGLKRSVPLNALPDKPNVRALQRPSRRERPDVPERIVDRELQKDSIQARAANQDPRLPAEPEVAVLQRAAGAEDIVNIDQIQPTADDISRPDLRVLPGGGPEAAIKRQPKPTAPLSSPRAPSTTTRSLPRQGPTTGRASQTSGTVEREERLLDNLLNEHKPKNAVEETIEKTERLSRMSPEQRARLQQDDTNIAARQKKQGEALIDERLGGGSRPTATKRLESTEPVPTVQKGVEKPVGEISEPEGLRESIKPIPPPRKKGRFAEKPKGPSESAPRPDRSQSAKPEGTETRPVPPPVRKPKGANGDIPQSTRIKSADDFVKFSEGRIEFRRNGQADFDTAFGKSGEVSNTRGARGELIEALRLLKKGRAEDGVPVEKIIVLPAPRGTRTPDFVVKYVGDPTLKRIEVTSKVTDRSATAEDLIPSIREKGTVRTGNRERLQLKEPLTIAEGEVQPGDTLVINAFKGTEPGAIASAIEKKGSEVIKEIRVIQINQPKAGVDPTKRLTIDDLESVIYIRDESGTFKLKNLK